MLEPLTLDRLQSAVQALLADIRAMPGFDGAVQALNPPPRVFEESFAWVRDVVDAGADNAGADKGVDLATWAEIANYDDRLTAAARRLLFGASWGARVLHLARCRKVQVALPTGGGRSWIRPERDYEVSVLIAEGIPVPAAYLSLVADRLRAAADEVERFAARPATARLEDQRQEAWQIVDPDNAARGRPSGLSMQQSWDQLFENARDVARKGLAGETLSASERQTRKRIRPLLNAAVTGVASDDVFASPADAPDLATRDRERKRARLLYTGLLTLAERGGPGR